MITSHVTSQGEVHVKVDISPEEFSTEALRGQINKNDEQNKEATIENWLENSGYFHSYMHRVCQVNPQEVLDQIEPEQITSHINTTTEEIDDLVKFLNELDLLNVAKALSKLNITQTMCVRQSVDWTLLSKMPHEGIVQFVRNNQLLNKLMKNSFDRAEEYSLDKVSTERLLRELGRRTGMEYYAKVRFRVNFPQL